MKHVRLTLSVPAGMADDVYDLLTRSEHVDAVRGLDWNVSDDRLGILHYVEGDQAGYVSALEAIPSVIDFAVTPAGEDAFYVYQQCELDGGAALLFETFTRGSLLIVPPVELAGDGTVTFSLLGERAEVQAAIDGVPDPIDVEVHEIGGISSVQETAVTSLSDRQREAAVAALELGYYEIPREASHEDVADALGCAPSTAAEHLRKAESKLLQSVLG